MFSQSWLSTWDTVFRYCWFQTIEWYYVSTMIEVCVVLILVTRNRSMWFSVSFIPIVCSLIIFPWPGLHCTLWCVHNIGLHCTGRYLMFPYFRSVSVLRNRKCCSLNVNRLGERQRSIMYSTIMYSKDRDHENLHSTVQIETMGNILVYSAKTYTTVTCIAHRIQRKSSPVLFVYFLTIAQWSI